MSLSTASEMASTDDGFRGPLGQLQNPCLSTCLPDKLCNPSRVRGKGVGQKQFFTICWQNYYQTRHVVFSLALLKVAQDWSSEAMVPHYKK